MNRALINCPFCNSFEASTILDLNGGNFDHSMLYPLIKISVCEKCGHVYNRLSADDIAGLMKYYNEEYAPANMCATDTTGDRPGSNNQNTQKRYGQLYNLISKHVSNDSKVLDIGCAMGGFLDYLHAHGLKNLSGIDPTKKYVDYAKQKGDYSIELGSAESIPFADHSFDVLVIDQVLEHLVEPLKAFQEAKRVLVEGGLFCLGVPDASRYDATYFFDFFWFLMKEHIQHFDSAHLKLAGEEEGFELINSNKSETPMMSAKMILPNLNVLFRLTGRESKMKMREESFSLKNKIEKYVAHEFARLKMKKAVIDTLVESQRPVYAWGIGREFLYLYEAAGLKNCNIVGLIDSNTYKQANVMLDGKRIEDKSILAKPATDSVLIITAIAHADAIKVELGAMGYKGEILEPAYIEPKFCIRD